MATNISEEEFLRLQNQLIELRTANYSLDEQLTLHKNQNKLLTTKLKALEKEVNKSPFTTATAKSVKHADLIRQNEALQLKIQTQEDEFRLQTDTLLQELSTLVKEKNEIVTKLSANVSGGEAATEALEMKNLRAELDALQNTLTEERLTSTSKISELKAALAVFSENEVMEKNNIFGEETNEVKRKPEIDNSLLVMKESNDGECIAEVLVDVQQAEKKKEAKVVASCYKNAEDELIQVKAKMELMRREFGVQIERLADQVKERVEIHSVLEAELGAVEKRLNFVTQCADMKEQKFRDNLKFLLLEQKKLLGVVRKYSTKKSELEAEVETLKDELKESQSEGGLLFSQLSEANKSLEQLNSSLLSLKEENVELKKDLNEAKKVIELKDSIKKIAEMAEMACLTADFEEKIVRLELEKKIVDTLLHEARETVNTLRENAEKMEKESLTKDEETKNLEQKLKDLIAENALNEKKRNEICRDLRRQLATERRRVERLQEKLHDVSDSSTVVKQDSSKVGDDATSISSWSLMSGNLDQQESSNQDSLVTGSPENATVDETEIEQENRNLLDRLTTLQQEKWVLEEKVNHLEQGSAAMAEDLVTKSEVIQHYCMDIKTAAEPQSSSSGRKSVKKLSEFLKGSEEYNSRMQRILEETLTKNMYLQRDVEDLTKKLADMNLRLVEETHKDA